MTVRVANDRGITRIIPPPLPPDGGGFWYLRRRAAAGHDEILLDQDGDYVRFDDEAQALHATADYGPGVYPKWMPKLITN